MCDHSFVNVGINECNEGAQILYKGQGRYLCK